MYITPINFNQQYSYKHSPQFTSRLYNETMRALEALDTFCQPNFSEPSVYIQSFPQKTKCKLGYYMDKSSTPKQDLEFAYKLCKNDFSNSYHYMDYKRFKNNFVYDKSSVVVIKSEDKNIGYYAAHVLNDDNLYIDEVDLVPEYRNTKKGAKVILDSWENITNLAKQKNCSKISLHVESDKKNLVNLYKHLGFNVIDSNSVKYKNGSIGYYMEKEI